ncbi:signal peptidase II [Amylibacter sp. IMCC11727]|uniref:signal peptidase II n=1 Tax=Amylibacter sp. IMCC11727 TaxID=3039851 RepID=UPI00244E1407|nr:signal peptidase II [Amylibacter sp. IMCC11727]WGI22600.1 signal peptidase II [Amylibacter sp. IMCC11727]
MKRILAMSIGIFVFDQITKFFVVEFWDLKNIERIDVFPPFLNFRMAWNEGINFGLFGDFDLRWFLIAISIVISIWVLWWGRNFTGWFGAFLVGCIVGGALGNTVDRVVYGAVADFLNMSCCGWRNPYSFNVADIAIFVGAFGLVLFSEKLHRKA